MMPLAELKVKIFVDRSLPLPPIDGIELRIRDVALLPQLGPIQRKDLISYLRQLGFSRPYHLRQAGISRGAWEML